MSKLDWAKQPWKHPAVWPAHLVKMTRDYWTADGCSGVVVSVASCECGWTACAKATGAGHVAQDDAVEAHWLDVIAEAEAVPA